MRFGGSVPAPAGMLIMAEDECSYSCPDPGWQKRVPKPPAPSQDERQGRV